VTAWARSAASGKIPAGKYVRLAAKRHLSDLKTGKGRGLAWDVAAAEKAIRFFTMVKHSKGQWAGTAFELSPWQAFIVGSLFGWKNADGTRRFRVAYNEIPRKNGKSTLAAGLAILLAFFDGEAGAEVYCAATKRDQAKIVFNEAKRMVDGTPGLKKRIQSLVANLNVPATGSKLEPLGADADSTDGLNPHGVVIDELHAHKSDALVAVLQSASGARSQPMRFEITTAGHDRTSVCRKHHEYSVRILEGVAEDDSWFGFIAGIDDGDDYADPKVWAKANLNLGVSVYPGYLAAECKRAQEIPSEQNTFRRLHLNQWTEQSERWLDVAAWDECAAEVEAGSGDRCWAGLDMASRMDLCAAAYLFGPDEDGVYDLRMRFWLPEEALTVEGAKAIKRAEADRLRLLSWVDEGYITVTSGNVTDYDQVERDLLKDFQVYDLVQLGFDPWNTTQLVTHLKDALGDTRVIPVPQTMSALSSPSKELEKLLSSRKLRHGGNPVLRWMASNVGVKHGPDGQIKPDRKASAEKVDGIFALIDALARATVTPTEGASVYETRDMVVI
jgi:phage terminase large subunit-like protein